MKLQSNERNKLMEEKYKKLIEELRWFEEYHKTMVEHYKEYNRQDLVDIHETAWSEFYLLLERFDENE